MTYRAGSALPIDVPANVGTGTNVRFYPGYDLVSVGQRLQELTQVDNGPDVFFNPYLTRDANGQYIRHQALIGTPDLVQPGDAVVFDKDSGLQSLKVSGDGSTIATGAFVKGSGQDRALMYARKESSRLTDLGWPVLDYVDTGHSSATEQATLDGYAAADLALYGGSIETWTATVRTTANAPLGSYLPGYRLRLIVNKHTWIPDGIYTSRLLGMKNGADAGVASLALEQRGGVF